MPELPEVETIVRYLRPKIRGKRILGVWSNTPRLFRTTKLMKSDFHGKSDFSKLLRGRKVIGVHREGKNIVLELSGGRDLYIHLMMTGKLLWNHKDLREPHIRFWMKLSGHNFLALHDIRKFGSIRLISGSPTSRGPSPAEATSAREGGKSYFGKLNIGPDAVAIDFKKFKSLIGGRSGAIKNILLNQKIIAGIGNIYSDEILWYAGVKPTRKADSLSGKEICALYASIRKVLALAIRKEGTSARDYRKPDGSEGGYYKIRKAYQRAGEKCSRDGAIIKRVVIGQRSSHFCPKHQK